MPYRKRGTLIALERAILEVAVRHASEGVYGFALAQELAADGAVGGPGLVAHGTLYKVVLDGSGRTGCWTPAGRTPRPHLPTAGPDGGCTR